MKKVKNAHKKLLSILLVIIMVVSIVPMSLISASASTGGKTQNDAVAWANSKVGSSLDYDGVYGAQCVDLTKYYYKYLGVSPVSGNGCDYATNSLPSGWSRIKYYSGFVPKPGDIAVWTYASSSYGHVAIITSADSSKMYVVEQNGSTGVTRSHSYSYSYGTFYGVIRPDFSGGSGSSESCKCSTSYAGNYVVSASGQNLNIRSGHSTSYSIVGKIPDKTEVYVSKASASAGSVGWGHVTYNGISGYVTMEGLVKKVTTYTVSYNANGGSGAPSSQQKQSGIAINISKTVPTRFGYIFKGWSTSSSSTTVNYIPGSSFSANANTTLYAVWESAFELSPILANAERTLNFSFEDRCIYYVITPQYDRRYRFESSGSVDAKIYIYNSLGTLLASDDDSGEGNNFKLDYDFSKNAKYYIKVQTYNGVKGEVNLSIKMFYRIRFDDNGGTIIGPNGNAITVYKYKLYDESVKISSLNVVRDGYEFLGWSSDPNATIAEYQPGSTYSENKSLILYAVWKIESPTNYTITYNPNGGSVSPTSKSVSAGSSTTLPTPTKSYKLTYDTQGGDYAMLPRSISVECNGWAISSSATSASYSCGASYKPTENITLYAVWEKTATTWVDMIYTEADKPKKSGYKFLGWSTDKNATAAEYGTGGDYITLTGDTTLYAVWEKIGSATTYKLTFNANGGSGAPSAKTGANSYTIPSASMIRSGYKFLGWALNKDATKAIFFEGSIIGLNADVTLYAVWEKLPVSTGKGITDVTVEDKHLKYNELSKLVIDLTGEDCDYEIEYASSDASIATVSEDGYVSANGRGTAKITVTVTDEYGNVVQDTCTVEVKFAWYQWVIYIVLFGWIWY